jgi:dTDP-glucose 4,6-dehydratase
MVRSFAYINSRLKLGAKLAVLTRQPLQSDDPAIEYWRGDISSFDFPKGVFSHLVHGANPTEGSWRLTETIESGTAKVIDFAGAAGVLKMLYLSSGAVYGRQPSALGPIEEDREVNRPETPADYASAKRAAERLCLSAGATIARGFAFLGPGLPLHGRFAAGNFIGNLLGGEPIRVTGDGTAVRSYLYTADLGSWLWTLLFQGSRATIYNVGSDFPICIADLARKISDYSTCSLPVTIERGPGASWYVPSIEKANRDLGLRVQTGLDEAIRRTIEWHQRGLKHPDDRR